MTNAGPEFREELKVREAGKLSRTVRSGGPRTAVGKANASGNSLKTGVFSTLTVLPDESVEEFNALVEQIIADCQANGAVERMLAEKLADICWKQKRLGRYESRAGLLAIGRPIVAAELEQVGLSIPSGAKDCIDMKPMDDEEYEAFIIFSILMENQIRDRKISVSDLEAFRESHPKIYEMVVGYARVLGLQDPTPLTLAHATIGPEGGNSIPLVLVAYEKVQDRFKGAIWATNHQADLEAAKQRVRDKRIYDVIRNERTARANEYLSREFSKTLADLRKQQEWRFKRAIDVTPRADKN